MDVYFNFTERFHAAPHIYMFVALQYFASGNSISFVEMELTLKVNFQLLGISVMFPKNYMIYIQFVSMPDPPDKSKQKNKSYEIAHFPSVLY